MGNKWLVPRQWAGKPFDFHSYKHEVSQILGIKYKLVFKEMCTVSGFENMRGINRTFCFKVPLIVLVLNVWGFARLLSCECWLLDQKCVLFWCSESCSWHGKQGVKAASKIEAFKLPFCLLKGSKAKQANKQKVVPKLIRGREVFSWECSLIPAQFNLTFTGLITSVSSR